MPTHTRAARMLAAAPALVAALAVAGCGGSQGESASTPTTTVTVTVDPESGTTETPTPTGVPTPLQMEEATGPWPGAGGKAEDAVAVTAYNDAWVGYGFYSAEQKIACTIYGADAAESRLNCYIAHPRLGCVQADGSTGDELCAAGIAARGDEPSFYGPSEGSAGYSAMTGEGPGTAMESGKTYTVPNSHLACHLENDGVTCWSELTGRGFFLGHDNFERF